MIEWLGVWRNGSEGGWRRRNGSIWHQKGLKFGIVAIAEPILVLHTVIEIRVLK